MRALDIVGIIVLGVLAADNSEALESFTGEQVDQWVLEDARPALANRIEIEAGYRLPTSRHLAWSPNGKLIAWAARNQDRVQGDKLFVLHVEEGSEVAVSESGLIDGIAWNKAGTKLTYDVRFFLNDARGDVFYRGDLVTIQQIAIEDGLVPKVVLERPIDASISYPQAMGEGWLAGIHDKSKLAIFSSTTQEVKSIETKVSPIMDMTYGCNGIFFGGLYFFHALDTEAKYRYFYFDHGDSDSVGAVDSTGAPGFSVSVGQLNGRCVLLYLKSDSNRNFTLIRSFDPDAAESETLLDSQQVYGTGARITGFSCSRESDVFAITVAGKDNDKRGVWVGRFGEKRVTRVSMSSTPILSIDSRGRNLAWVNESEELYLLPLK